MRKRNFLSEIKTMLVFVIALCAVLWVPGECSAQFNKLKDKVKKVMKTDSTQTTDNPVNSGLQNRDAEETIENAYVFYVSKVEGFQARFHDAGQVAKEALDYAAQLDAVLKANPQYRERKLGSIVRNDSIEMTVAELLDKLNRAGEIISQGQSDLQTQNMSYFVQGDVEDWKNRTDKLDANDGFILLANYEYALVFDRAAGEKDALAKYSKGNGGKPLPASVIVPLHNQIDRLLAKMNSLAPQYSFSGGGQSVDQFIVGYIKNQAAENIPGATVLKTFWTNDAVIIDKNELGVPVLKRRLGTALYRVPNQTFCVEQHFFYHEKYAGGGKYLRGADVNFSDLRFVKCQ